MQVIPHEDVPEGVVMPAAYCTADFDTVCKRISAHPAVHYITYSKRLKKTRKRYRCVGIELDSGRFATLLKEDSDDYFQFWLQRKGYGYYLAEIGEIKEFIGVENGQVVLLDNALIWIQPKDSEPLRFDKITVGWQGKNQAGAG
jgi:hypothetical protein